MASNSETNEGADTTKAACRNLTGKINVDRKTLLMHARKTHDIGGSLHNDLKQELSKRLEATKLLKVSKSTGHQEAGERSFKPLTLQGASQSNAFDALQQTSCTSQLGTLASEVSGGACTISKFFLFMLFNRS